MHDEWIKLHPWTISRSHVLFRGFFPFFFFFFFFGFYMFFLGSSFILMGLIWGGLKIWPHSHLPVISYPESMVSSVSGWSSPGGTFEDQKSGIPVTHEHSIKKLDIYSIPPESNQVTTTADRGDRWLWVWDSPPSLPEYPPAPPRPGHGMYPGVCITWLVVHR